jgi:uncharacterized membrane protein YuzA (DUF378 family)
MIERLVFIATMFFFVMIGVNGFLMMANTLPAANGTPLNLFTGTSTLDGNNFFNQTGNINVDANAAQGLSTSGPGTASGIPLMNYASNPVGFLGLDWIKQALFGANMVGLRMAAEVPIASPLIYILVGIASALQAFFFMYWAQAGARALFSRFL